MRRLLETARQAARSEASILLAGESGTGKNVLAREIHTCSVRGQNPSTFFGIYDVVRWDNVWLAS